MKTRLFAVGLAAPVVLMLAACASSTIDGQGSGKGTPAPSVSSTGSGSASAPPSTTGPATSSSSGSPAVSLEAQLVQGLSSAKTAHLNLSILAGSQLIAGGGDEQISDGKLIALNLTESVGQGLKLSLIIVHGKTYVKLPAQLNTSGKPWQLVTAKSSNATVRALASSLASTQSSASLASIAQLISAARSVKQTGSGTTGGLPTKTYLVDVDPAKLPASYEGKQAIIASGITSIPVKITIDSMGRPVVVTENLSVQGQKVAVKITVGAYNKPVHITAPPKRETSTR